MADLIVPNSIAHLVSDFGLTLVTRGSQYFQQKRFRIESLNGFDANVVVVGTYEYEVAVRVAPRKDRAGLFVDCSCPYAQRDGLCKHIWCALIALQDRGWIGLDAPKLRLTHPDEYEGWAYEDDSDEWDDPDEFFSQALGEGPPEGYAMLRLPYRLGAEPRPTPAEEAVYMLVVESPFQKSLVPGRLNQRGDFSGVHDIGALVAKCKDGDERALLFDLMTYGSGTGDPVLYSLVLPRLAQQGRLLASNWEGEATRVVWEEEPATITLKAIPLDDTEHWAIMGVVHAGDVRQPIDDPGDADEEDELDAPSDRRILESVPGNCVLELSRVGAPRLRQFDSHLAARWFEALYLRGSVTVFSWEREEFLSDQLEHGFCSLELPPGFEYERRSAPLEKLLRIREERGFRATVSFVYQGREIDWSDERRSLLVWQEKVALKRDEEAEAKVCGELSHAGFVGKGTSPGDPIRKRGELRLKKSHFTRAVTGLLEKGWQIYGEKGRYRTMTAASTRVSTGKDWFDLHGRLEFGDQSMSLADVLRALKKRALDRRFVQLTGGSVGLLPDRWLDGLRSSPQKDGSLRFSLAQVGVVHALTEGTQHERDAQFERLRRLLLEGDIADKVQLPTGFRAQLRPYQEHGVAWLAQLRQLGLGACLADDMGLGKTVQVLALLHACRQQDGKKDRSRPFLVVAPRSVVENWASETARFCPRLRVVVHLGGLRATVAHDLEKSDVVITSFAILRLDADLLASIHFDTIVIDEAQNMKNAAAKTSIAAKSLSGDHRLALTGTPMENHLGDLWSIFDFLNPGMLGYLGGGRRPPTDLDGAAQKLLEVGVRPFLLRRTKDQVAPDLPARTEQQWRLDLPSTHRRLYDDLAEEYRRRIAEAKKSGGSRDLNALILEGLLRLRQAACHPLLLDNGYTGKSVKIESVCEHLAILREEGRKALVFSQFTSFLQLLAKELKSRKLRHEYLDGSTRRRPEVIRRFRETPDCCAFLISLKAGGVGLNLTEADTVFVLDPWWNPAAEAQAIDRAHRIGQDKAVFAWRLVARDTIEERVIELQEDKRQLAEAVLGGTAPVSQLTQAEMLALLE